MFLTSEEQLAFMINELGALLQKSFVSLNTSASELHRREVKEMKYIWKLKSYEGEEETTMRGSLTTALITGSTEERIGAGARP